MWRRMGGITDAEAAYLAVVPYLRLEGRWQELNTDTVRGFKGPASEWVPVEQALVAREQGNAARAWDTIWQKLPDGPRMSVVECPSGETIETCATAGSMISLNSSRMLVGLTASVASAAGDDDTSVTCALAMA